MKTYEHTQRGTVVYVCFALATAIVAVSIVRGASIFWATPLIFAFALFHSLTVAVDETRLRVSFGVGIVRFSYRLSEIVQAYPVRNEWYYGWGIRILREGILLNISGLDAVEIVLRSGGVRRIGTDEPAALLEAIERARV